MRVVPCDRQSIGVLNGPAYATIVLVAVLTTVMAAPLLRICVRRADEAARVPHAREQEVAPT